MNQKMKPKESFPLKERHPVIAALINVMPNVEDGWSEEDQHSWLKMFAMAMQVAYGGQIARFIGERNFEGDGLPTSTLELAKAVRTPPVDTRPAKFHIDQSGFVRNTKTGQAVNLEDVDTDEIFDMRGPDSNLDEVTWANGDVGAGGYKGIITS
jgi:hypothetical protein